MVLLIFVAANVAEKLLSYLRKNMDAAIGLQGPSISLTPSYVYIYEIAILKHETVCKVSTIAKCKK
jgi:hypothetical protein